MKCSQWAEIPKHVAFGATDSQGLSRPPHLLCLTGGSSSIPFRLSPPILRGRGSLQLLDNITIGQHVLWNVFLWTPTIEIFLSAEIILCSLQVYYPRRKRTFVSLWLIGNGCLNKALYFKNTDTAYFSKNSYLVMELLCCITEMLFYHDPSPK